MRKSRILSIFDQEISFEIPVIPVADVELILWLGTDDIPYMIDYELEQLLENVEWQRLLQAYAEQIAQTVSLNPEHEGWVERIQNVDHVEQEHLPRIHGKLIALGFLKFELGSRHAGVQYQLTQSGQRALNGLTGNRQADAA